MEKMPCRMMCAYGGKVLGEENGKWESRHCTEGEV